MRNVTGASESESIAVAHSDETSKAVPPVDKERIIAHLTRECREKCTISTLPLSRWVLREGDNWGQCTVGACYNDLKWAAKNAAGLKDGLCFNSAAIQKFRTRGTIVLIEASQQFISRSYHY
jgi:hypothetical protein